MDFHKSVSIANLVPYTGAKKDVDLGGHNVQGGNLSGTNTGDQDLSGLVPYSGATGDVDLGSHGIIQAALKLTASPSDGYILTSDANGQASWKAPASGWNNSLVSMYDSVDQTIASGAFTVKELDTTALDVLGEADLTNNRITVQEAGYYLIIGSARAENDFGVYQCLGTIFVNAGQRGPYMSAQSNHNWPAICVSVIYHLEAGDYVDFRIYQDTGADQTFIGAWSGLQIRRIL